MIAGPLPGGEAIAYADAEIERIVPRKIVHDYAGDYNRFDIFQLIVNQTPAGAPIRLGGLVSTPRPPQLEGARTLLIRDAMGGHLGDGDGDGDGDDDGDDAR